jgi:uncharacterized protein (DUF924 family)
LDFWFGPPPGGFRPEWFAKDAAFDASIRTQFLSTYERAARAELDGWSESADGALALVIVLDQFPRNLFRDDARAFATDARARRTASDAIARGLDRALVPLQRMFLYLPFEHSEDIADQDRSVALFESIEDASVRDAVLDYALRHRDIVRRFGRFPHRNRVLGRTSTPAEVAFLATPGSSF